MSDITDLLARPLAVRFGTADPADGGRQMVVPVDAARRPAGWLAGLLLVGLMVGGIALSLVSVAGSFDERHEGLSTLGLELGAAVWFAAAVTWGARRNATVARALLLVASLIAGLTLVLSALVLRWTDEALDLAMEYGVGLMAIPLVDVVLLGVLHARVSRFAAGTSPVSLTIGPGWRVRVVAAVDEVPGNSDLGN